jgi:histidinol-phosphate aminotransferase
MGELLSELGWLQPLPSETNFVLCRVDQHLTGFRNLSGVPSDLPIGKQVKLALEQHGVLVRWFDKDGLRDCIRISVGRPDQTDKLIVALKAIRQ